jgi:hypothetical protein
MCSYLHKKFYFFLQKVGVTGGHLATHHDQWPFCRHHNIFHYLPFVVMHHIIPQLAICSSASHHIFHYLPFAFVISASLFGLT